MYQLLLLLSLILLQNTTTVAVEPVVCCTVACARRHGQIGYVAAAHLGILLVAERPVALGFQLLRVNHLLWVSCSNDTGVREDERGRNLERT